jgi:hypothetical protein
LNSTSLSSACMCDRTGSLNSAKCDPYEDKSAGLVAGQCHCKSLVEGQNCDRCMNGYFNLTEENPDGCQSCSCNTIGTTGNMGCDKVSGLCSCKRFVTGRACDRCLVSESSWTFIISLYWACRRVVFYLKFYRYNCLKLWLPRIQLFYRIIVVVVLYRIRSVIFGPYISRTVSPNNLGPTYSELPDLKQSY